MNPRSTTLSVRPSAHRFLRLLSIGFTLAGLMVSNAIATELGASVYPAGVETVMPGMTPPRHIAFAV